MLVQIIAESTTSTMQDMTCMMHPSYMIYIVIWLHNMTKSSLYDVGVTELFGVSVDLLIPKFGHFVVCAIIKNAF
jgi:hypothetical protein